MCVVSLGGVTPTSQPLRSNPEHVQSTTTARGGVASSSGSTRASTRESAASVVANQPGVCGSSGFQPNNLDVAFLFTLRDDGSLQVFAQEPPPPASVAAADVQQKQLANDKLTDTFTNDFDGQRDRLMFELLYQTGIRLSELIGLKDVDTTNSQIKVLGKRNKERIIPISKDLGELINKYRKLRSEIPVSTNALLVLKTGKNLYPKFVYRRINKYLSLATDVNKKSPHVLRHTFATHMLNNGAGLEVLKELLGHANLSATQVYTHNSFAELTAIYSQSHPRGQQN